MNRTKITQFAVATLVTAMTANLFAIPVNSNYHVAAAPEGPEFGLGNLSNFDVTLPEVLPTPAEQTPTLATPSDQKEENEPEGSAAWIPDDQVVEVVRERYDNRRVKIEREVTLDDNGNYVNHGKWKMWNPAGKLISEGTFNLGKRTGTWTRWHLRADSPLFGQAPFTKFQPPYISQATFAEGELDGDWMIFDAKQQKISQISFQHGKRQGPMVLWMPDGRTLQQANYHNNVIDGDFLQTDRSGKLARKATYLMGRRVASKVTYFDKAKKTKKIEAAYLISTQRQISPDDFWNARFAEYDTAGEDQRHGPWKAWYNNGQVQLKGMYRNNREIGSFTWWHPNGQKAVDGQYSEGKQNGQWTWWHTNGLKATQGGFASGRQVGQWRSWAEDGHLRHQMVYNGQENGNSEFNIRSASGGNDRSSK